MSKCTNPETGVMLHAWELGVLPDGDRQRFELHLLTCDACAQEAAQFAKAAKLLQYDLAPKPEAGEATESPAEALSEKASSRRWITRVLLAAAVIVIAAIPVYRMVISPEDAPAIVQKLNLVPVRGGSNNSVTRAANGNLEIRFYVEGASASQVCRVSVLDQADTPVFVDDSFRAFSNAGVGVLKVPVQVLDAGLYTLVVRPLPDTTEILQQYSFRVK